MVAVALLLVIVTGLTMMFLQTQRAFRTGLGQVDVFESGRTAMELVSRDLEQMAASSDRSNYNFIAELAYPPNTVIQPPAIDKTTDTHYLRNLFVLTHGSDWQGISYKVLNPDDPVNTQNVVVGSLYRHTTNSTRILGNYLFLNYYNEKSWANYHRLIDGVVRFQVKLYTAEGIEITNYNTLNGSSIATNQVDIANDVAMPNTGLKSFEFHQDALPGYIELELGILEPATAELVKSLPPGPNRYVAQKEFVQRNSGKIHIFRQQIPIRAATR